MNELPHELEPALKALKERAARRAARVDPETVAARVVTRLRAERAAARGTARPWPVPVWARVAAVLVVVLAAGIIGTVAVRGPSASRGMGLPVTVTDLGAFDDAQYRAVLEAAQTVRPVMSPEMPHRGVFTTLDQLSEAELAALLQTL